jgi:signal transduction histidine kinase
VAPPLVAALLLALPAGPLWTRVERRFLVLTGGALALMAAPPGHLLRPLVLAAWLVLVLGVVILLYRRRPRTASVPLRWLAAAQAGGVTTLVVLAPSGPDLVATSAVVASAVPLAIVLGLALERLFLGRVLADLVTGLAQRPRADPASVLALALGDPALQIVEGPHAPGVPAGRAITWIARHDAPAAAVVYDAELAEQEPFVQAAGAAALATRDLVASRTRLVDTAHAERQRIERDLHDSVQQDLVGLRIRLDMLGHSDRRDQRMIAALGTQVDDIIEEVRSLARGIYPAILDDSGLERALTAAAWRLPKPVTVAAGGVGRQAREVEVAVYFCCLEALQNFAKHAGEDATAAVRIRRDRAHLCFEVADTGAGFDPAGARAGQGVVNMRDRIDAVGGTLMVTSAAGEGTCVHGRVPCASRGAVRRSDRRRP